MAYYDALIAEWSTLAAGTTAQKLAAINAETVAGPNIAVAVSQVVGSLLLSGGYATLSSFAAGALNSNATHDAALMAAKTLMALMTVPNSPAIDMSNPTTLAIVKGMADAILAQETAAPGGTGFTQAVHDGLLALCATSIPWWKVSGYSSPISAGDLSAAGGLT
jgi:hypothetical protein